MPRYRVPKPFSIQNMSRPSVIDVISQLNSLSLDTGAELVIHNQTEFWGCTLIVHWDNVLGTGKGSIQDMPREAHIFFSTDKTPVGVFQWAYIYDPARYLNALEEGLTDKQAEEESRRMVQSIDQVINYLLAREYKFVKKVVVDKGK